jgi:two-component system, NtrC family, sensor histidine kinase GlrK
MSAPAASSPPGPTHALPTLPRPSFRQLLLVSFLLVATLLAGVSLSGLATLQKLLDRNRAGAEQALQLSGQVKRLGDHGLAMERAARQYLVLSDRSLRLSFERAAGEATQQVQALAATAVSPALARAWREQLARVENQLASPPGTGDAEVAEAFGRLNQQVAEMAEQVRLYTEARNTELQAAVESGRAALARRVLASIGVAMLLALVLAVMLARPLKRVEEAIVALGENRLEQRIEIQGPSDVRQIGRQLDWLRQRLARGDADKARFLRHVSHELKTPLAALREGVALLGDGVAGPLSDDQREVARILGDNTAALQRRIEDLLLFNATAFAAQRLVRKPTALAPLVARLVDEQQLQWRARGVHVEQRVLPPGAVLVAEVDAELLGSALANLLSNAIRYSPPGATIRVDLSRFDDSLRIDIADQGPGVAEVDRTRIFEPFYRGRTQPDSGLPGTGIGLSIVAEAVAAHGGQVSLAPSDTGACFRIELPHALADR